LDGLRRQLHETGTAVEHVINQGMEWLGDSDAKKLMVSLLLMRRFEAEQRLQSNNMSYTLFFFQYDHFRNTMQGVQATTGQRADIENRVKAFAETFSAWSGTADKVRPKLKVID